MSLPLRVQLDLARIAANLQSAGDPVSESEVLDFLRESGFIRDHSGWWICEEISLDSLDRSEILDILRL